MELIFVHGALVRDGEWWWRRAGALLEQRTGIRSRALALPSCGELPGERGGGLVADAAALRRALDELPRAVVVGHSYGGTVIAEAGRHPAVAHLLLISSYLPEIGTSQAEILGDEADPVTLADGGEGTLRLDGHDAASFAARFVQDDDRATQREAFARLTRQDASAFVTPTTRAGWQGVDSSYLVCVDDRSTSVGLQRRHAARATRSVELPTGHHPFLSRPELVVDALEALVGGCDRDAGA